MLSPRLSTVAAVTAVAVAALAAPAVADYGPAAYSYTTERVVVPMTFPVVGPVSYTDTFLACRSDCARQHMGQDLMGPKMNVAVAAFNGYVWSVKRETTVGGGNYLTLKGDNGWSANYIHMNNDTPGTDDGKGTVSHFTAPGISVGKRVFAGEILGWVGDSGNAEGTAPHLHFELRKGEPWTGTVYNAYDSLRAARVLTKPTTSGPHAEGSFVKGCAGTCSVWRLNGGLRHLVRPEVLAELGVAAGSVVPVTQNEARWYKQGPDVQLPVGRAYRGPDDVVWLVTGGWRHVVPDAAALRRLGIPSARVRPVSAAALATVPVSDRELPRTVFYDGALLRVPNAAGSYWHVTGGQRRPVTDAATLASWGLADADAVTIPATADPNAMPPLGTALPLRDGLLVKDANGRRYVVSAATKRPFLSYALFRQYGYATVLVLAPPAAALTRLPTGPRLP